MKQEANLLVESENGERVLGFKGKMEKINVISRRMDE